MRSRSRSHASGRASERSALGSRNFKIAARPRKANRRGTRAREVRRIDPIRWADIGNRPDARRRSRQNQGFVRQQWNDTGCLGSPAYPLFSISTCIRGRAGFIFFRAEIARVNSTTRFLDRWIPAFRSLLLFPPLLAKLNLQVFFSFSFFFFN